MVTRNGLITLIASGATTVAAYVFQTVMARLMSTSEFGELSSIVATLNIAAIPIFGISTAITHDVAASRAKSAEQLGLLVGPHARRVASITVVMIVGLVVLSPWLIAFLQLSSLVPLLFLAALVALTNLVGIGRAVLLGLHDIASLAVNQVAEALTRLVSGITMAVSGLIATAGFAGYSLGLLAALLLVVSRLPSPAMLRLATQASRPLKSVGSEHAPGQDRDISWRAIVVAGASAVLLNIDLVVVKHFFPPEEAGQYAAISTLAKGLFLITNAFDVVLFPAAAAARAAGADGIAHLRRAILSVGVIVVPILAVYWLLGAPLVELLFGARYVAVAQLLGPYGVAITLLGVATLLTRYRLAIGRGISSSALLGLVGAASGGLLVFHETLAQVVGVLLVTGVAALVLALAGTRPTRPSLWSL
jgi:O-antigen/teichoic acid export membrane protein